MKRFSTVLSVLMAVTLVFAPTADAKRMGGKSFGRTYKTAPAPAKKQPQSGNTLKESSQSSGQKTTADKQQSQQTSQQSAQQQKSSRWGMLGGALKRFSTVLSVLMAVTLVFAPTADAKRMGGKSFGRTYKTAPAPAKKQPQSGNTLKESSQSSGQKTTADKQQSQQTSQQRPVGECWVVLWPV